jgi:lipopolysaccharide transport system ATP-binding protein
MSDIILKVENISKQYRLGLVGTGTIAHDLNRFWHRVRGKEDPYLQVGAVNDRSASASSDYVWALQDINFEVKRGEILGIIGKNGAGKSTLLKILSRVTSPTTGSIKTRGRIASLLEVGTGMHPELTGRENIFLNGAILGMNKTEISSKIDEIVEFSGCQMYIDTPVKRYSSGMRVRLGFAVAAFLEPDILVVDEVLAVGDAEFQKKAIGKMQDISNTGGRTVLFVSHNMAAVKDLCTKLVLLENGGLTYHGDVNDGINKYLSSNESSSGIVEFNKQPTTVKAHLSKFEILNSLNKISYSFNSNEDFIFKIYVKVNRVIRNPVLSVRVSDMNNVNVITWRSNAFINSPLPANVDRDFSVTISPVDIFILEGVYTVSIGFSDGKEILDMYMKFINFQIQTAKFSDKYNNLTKDGGSGSLVFSDSKWEFDG